MNTDIGELASTSTCSATPKLATASRKYSSLNANAPKSAMRSPLTTPPRAGVAQSDGDVLARIRAGEGFRNRLLQRAANHARRRHFGWFREPGPPTARDMRGHEVRRRRATAGQWPSTASVARSVRAMRAIGSDQRVSFRSPSTARAWDAQGIPNRSVKLASGSRAA
jgi:hypothetical protein